MSLRADRGLHETSLSVGFVSHCRGNGASASEPCDYAGAGSDGKCETVDVEPGQRERHQHGGPGFQQHRVGMGVAASGYLPPVAGAVMQEVIDVLAVLNALRVAAPRMELNDLE